MSKPHYKLSSKEPHHGSWVVITGRSGKEGDTGTYLGPVESGPFDCRIAWRDSLFVSIPLHDEEFLVLRD